MGKSGACRHRLLSKKHNGHALEKGESHNWHLNSINYEYSLQSLLEGNNRGDTRTRSCFDQEMLSFLHDDFFKFEKSESFLKAKERFKKKFIDKIVLFSSWQI